MGVRDASSGFPFETRSAPAQFPVVFLRGDFHSPLGSWFQSTQGTWLDYLFCPVNMCVVVIFPVTVYTATVSHPRNRKIELARCRETSAPGRPSWGLGGVLAGLLYVPTSRVQRQNQTY